VQAIEFAAQIQNGRIELPAQFQAWMNIQPVRVIVLLDHAHTASIMPQQRPLGLLRGQLNVNFAEDFKMTEEEFLQS